MFIFIHKSESKCVAQATMSKNLLKATGEIKYYSIHFGSGRSGWKEKIPLLCVCNIDYWDIISALTCLASTYNYNCKYYNNNYNYYNYNYKYKYNANHDNVGHDFYLVYSTHYLSLRQKIFCIPKQHTSIHSNLQYFMMDSSNCVY